MGYLNNQWLDGRALRDRKHHPIEAKIIADPVLNPWDVQHDVRASFRIERSGGDYQFLLFTDEDMPALEKVAGSVSPENRLKIALAAMAGATDVEIISFMQSLFERRATQKS
jgi:hypothetical protein